ncbi:FABP family protein [Microterricola pindariensis]|uniref:Peroxynitrite isomerase n=1 Tax=Microterricola pindariensis TaxID=478010 RepID=A0ABX5AXR5_9MICO|nr:FABP family protein [Microterricola pindariensis]PPL19696.1 FABP family protein [Microterricola pindariensis]
MIEIPLGLPAELVPLSWLLGVWEGSGVLDYSIDPPAGSPATAEPTKVTREFGQRVSFAHDGLPYLSYHSYSWLLPEEEGGEPTPLVTETGYWRLSRPLGDADAGPGLLPGTAAPRYPDAESVETLRNAAGGFDIEVSLVHPNGVSELYLGQVLGPRIDLATDAVVRTETAKHYAAATRLYGLVDNHLLWAWDIAALGQTLRTHASGRLAKVD